MYRARRADASPLTGRGDVNTDSLFAELFSSAINSCGRAGVIVPTGVATDATTAPFFGSLVDTGRLASLFAFENEELIFPAVHHAFKFGILTIRPKDELRPAEYVFFARQAAALSEPERGYTLTSAELRRLNPNVGNAPIFRSRADAALTASIYDACRS